VRRRVTDKRAKRNWGQKAFGRAPAVRETGRPERNRLRVSLGEFIAEIELGKDAPEVAVTLTGTGALKEPPAFPPPFASERGAWLVVPLNEGIIYPVDDEGIRPRQLAAYSGHGISMPWFGVTDPATGAGAGPPGDVLARVSDGGPRGAAHVLGERSGDRGELRRERVPAERRAGSAADGLGVP